MTQAKEDLRWLVSVNRSYDSTFEITAQVVKVEADDHGGLHVRNCSSHYGSFKYATLGEKLDGIIVHAYATDDVSEYEPYGFKTVYRESSLFTDHNRAKVIAQILGKVEKVLPHYAHFDGQFGDYLRAVGEVVGVINIGFHVGVFNSSSYDANSYVWNRTVAEVAEFISRRVGKVSA